MRFLAVAFLSVTTVSIALQLPRVLPLSKRQSIAPGSPLYECHAHCGGVIEDAQDHGYCTNSTYSTDLKDCLKCALTYNIWQYYGSDVASAASVCGDHVTPSPSSATDAAAASSTVTSVASSSIVPATTTSSAIMTPSAGATAVSSSTATTATLPTSSSSTTPVSTFTGAAARVEYKKDILLAVIGAAIHVLA